MGGNSKNSNPKFTRERQIFHYTFLFDAYRAAAIANRVSLTLIIMAAILALSLFRIHDSYGMLKLLLAIIGFAFGLSLFLQEYLLYRFENEE